MKFILPHFFENRQLNFALTELYTYHPDIFKYQNIHFIYVEGSYPYFQWAYHNNNNLHSSPIVTREQINTNYNSRAGVLLDCANDLLVQTDLLDVKCNYILQSMENGSNAISVGTPLMLEYILTHYPGYYLIGNINFPFNDPDGTYKNQLKYIKQSHCDLENEWYQDIPKSKIFLNAITTCSACSNYWQCKNQNQLNKIMFSEKNCIIECQSAQVKTLSEEQIKNFLSQGYQNFYFETDAFNPVNTYGFMDLYINFFIKPEHALFAKDFLGKGWLAL